jgi:hypothetical protein
MPLRRDVKFAVGRSAELRTFAAGRKTEKFIELVTEFCRSKKAKTSNQFRKIRNNGNAR